MSTARRRRTKEKIMESGWKLFLAQGYEETTISQIIEHSGTSRSAFYHHFHGKEELLFSLAYAYDSEYDAWFADCDPTLPAVEKLRLFNRFVFQNLEDSPYGTLFSSLYGLQVTTAGYRHILNPERRYYHILRTLLKDGLEKGEIVSEYTYTELTDLIASMQIGLTYTWCLQQKRFSILQYSELLITPFLETLQK